MNTHQQTKEEYLLDICVFMDCLDEVAEVPGDFAEFGVFRGNSFMLVINYAKMQGKHTHAFDSFRGMAKPVKEDLEPVTNHTIYPEGYLDQGGPEYLIKRLTEAKYDPADYTIQEGFIPQIFKTIKKDLTFSFAYLDLDHYRPTKYALEWAWGRIVPGGIMLCDDFFIEELWGASSLATTQFISKHVDEFDILRRTSRRIALRKR